MNEEFKHIKNEYENTEHENKKLEGDYHKVKSKFQHIQ